MTRLPLPARPRAAFTLIELLVLIAIIAILIGLLLPGVQKVREAASRMKCQNNMKQIGLALHNYHDTRNGFPGGGTMFSGTAGNSFHVYILPYLEQDAIFSKFNLTQTYNSATNSGQKTVGMKGYLCPSQAVVAAAGADAGWSTIHYVGNMGPHGNDPSGTAYGWTSGASTGGYATQGALRAVSWQANSDVRITEVTDGSSNTIMVGELSWLGATTQFRGWNRGCGDSTSTYGCNGSKNVAYSINNPASFSAGTDLAFGSTHSNGANFVFCDGSTRFLTDSLPLSSLMSLSSRNGGEVVATP